MRRLLLGLSLILGLACGCSGEPNLEKAARRDARQAIARGDYRVRPMDAIRDEASRRYSATYNETIVLEQPFITPANRLEERIVAMARDHSAANTAAFSEALLAAKVYLPSTREGAALAKAQPSAVTFMRMPTEKDRRAMVMFSSVDRLRQAFHNDTEWYVVGVTGRQALELSGGSQVVVNYGLQPPVYIEPDQVEALLAPSPKPAP
jgi:hypothetical protein